MSVARLVNADESTWQQLSTVVKQAGEVKTSWDDPPVILTHTGHLDSSRSTTAACRNHDT